MNMRSIFVRNLASMMMLSCAGALLFGCILIPHALDANRATRSAQYAERLEQTRQSMDALIATLYRYPGYFQENAALRPYALASGDGRALIAAKREIRQYTSQYPIVFEAFYHVAGTHSVVGKNGAWQLSDIGESLYRFGGAAREAVLDAFEHPDAHRGEWLDVQSVAPTPGLAETPIAMLCLPVPLTGAKPYASLLLALDERQLLRELRRSLDGDIVFLAQDDRILCASDALDADMRAAWDARDPAGGPELLQALSGTPYLLSRTPSHYAGLQYVAIARRDAVYADTTWVALQYALWILGVLWALFLISYGMSRFSYRPLRALVRALDDDPGRRAWQVNDTSVIENALATLRSRNDELASELHSYHPYLRASLIRRLVSGQYDDADAMARRCAQVGIAPAHPYLCAIELSPAPLQGVPSPEGRDEQAFLAPDEQAQRAIGFLALPSDDAEALRAYLRALRERMQDVGDAPAIRVGRIVSGLGDLRLSYGDIAQRAPDPDAHAEDPVAALAPHGDEPESPLVERLHRAALARDIDAFSAAMRALIDAITDPRLDMRAARALAMEALRPLAPDIRRQGDLDMGRLNPFGVDWLATRPAIADMLQTVADRLSRGFASRETLKNHLLVEDLLLYIDEHILDDDFSISSISEAFHMSESAFSHMFKRHLNTTFIGYVNRIKADKARYYLLETDMTIEEISERLRYSHPSNFSRMFKGIVGASPGSYRSENRKRG